MGAGNVKAVYGNWGHLVPDPAFRLLVFMALSTKDDDDPPTCWHAWQSLALGLGRRPPHDDSDRRAVGRAMKQLRDVGAVEGDRRSSPGRTARHVLLIHGPTTGDATRPVNVGRDATGTGDATRPERGTPDDRIGDATRPLEEHQEHQGLTNRLTTHLDPSVQRPKRGPLKSHEFDPEATGGRDCVACPLPPENAIHRRSA